MSFIKCLIVAFPWIALGLILLFMPLPPLWRGCLMDCVDRLEDWSIA